MQVNPSRQTLFSLSGSRRSFTVSQAALQSVLRDPWLVSVQLGVSIPFGCQIGAKGAFDVRKAVSTWDGNSAFNMEPGQASLIAPLASGLWTANASAVARSAGGIEYNGRITRGPS